MRKPAGVNRRAKYGALPLMIALAMGVMSFQTSPVCAFVASSWVSIVATIIMLD